MKINCYYHTSFGRNDGPPLYYFNVLKNQMKLDVTHLVPEGDISRFGKADYHFWVDYGEDGLPVDRSWKIPNDGGKKIYVCSDAHFNAEGKRYRFEKAKEFDYVFFNQKRAFEEYTGTKGIDRLIVKKRGMKKQHIQWLPHAAEPQAYPNITTLKKFDVCFIGHIQNQNNYNGFSRLEALDTLFKKFSNFYFGTRTPLDPKVNIFEDAARKFSQSRIVFNISAMDDINMRVFETLSTGSFLLTNWIPTIGELFEDGKHLVTYKTLDEMVEKVTYYLVHDEEREQIAQQGYDEFRNRHTYRSRINTIFEAVGQKIGGGDKHVE